MVHAVSSSTGDKHVTVCHHNDYFLSYGEGFYHKWPLTDERVTCKRCLRTLGKKPYHVELYVDNNPLHREFTTDAERQAYILGVKDARGQDVQMSFWTGGRRG